MVMRDNSAGRTNRLPRAYRFGASAVSALAMAALLPVAAFAQEAPAQDDASLTSESGEIIVSGIRYSIATSLNTKKNNDSIVEAVSAEEIGKLPDVSIAESIARLPGLAGQRIGGRTQNVMLRGFSPDFTTTLLNGRAQASSGDNRAVEFDQYPSELLSSVVVYKTPDANIAGMGLAGSVDLRTVRPLAYGKNAFAVNLRGEVNGSPKLNADVKNWGWRGSLSWIGQNADGTFGWALGYAHLDSPSAVRHFKGYNYEKFDNNCFDPGGPSWCGKINPTSARQNFTLNGQEVFATSRSNKRDAGVAILEWQPSETVHSTLDLFYSQFNQKEVMRGMQWFDNPWADSAVINTTATGTIGGSTVSTAGSASQIAPIIRNDHNTRKDDLFSVGWNNEFKIDDTTNFVADLSYSKNIRHETIIETYAGYGCCVTNANMQANRVFDSYTFDIANVVDGSAFPAYAFGLNYADASNVSLGERDIWNDWRHDGAVKSPTVKQTVYAVDLGLSHELGDGFFKRLDVGLNYTHTDKIKLVDEYDLNLKNNRLQTLVGSGYLVNPTSLSFAGLGNVLSYNVPAVIPVYYNQTDFVDANSPNKDWSVKEDLITAKFKLSIESGNLHGNIGLQMIRADQRSDGAAINMGVTPAQVVRVYRGAAYTDWMPSLNLWYDLGGGHRVRFGASKQMARPRMDQIRADFLPSASNPCGGAGAASAQCQPGGTIHPWSATGGNPALEPWRAKSFDLAYEWYIDKTSYIAIAGFHKSLDNYIYEEVDTWDFTGLILPPTTTVPVGVTVSPIGTITQAKNGKGGYLNGYEISGALGFGKLASFLDGFGIQASYAFTKSNLHPTRSTNPAIIQATRIPGLSKHVYNITGYFEKWGFQARASYRYRSGFKGEVPALFADRGLTEILPDRQVDAQIGYTFGDESSLKGLSVLLQANNLANAPYRTRLGVDAGGTRTSDGSSLPEVYEKYGTQFLFGMSYKF